MARVKKSDVDSVEESRAKQVAEKAGRALIDLPAYKLLSGEYATLTADVADSLEAIGAFDTNAVEVQE